MMGDTQGQLDRQPSAVGGGLRAVREYRRPAPQMIFFSIAEGEHAWMFWRWPTALRWNRIFSIVR